MLFRQRMSAVVLREAGPQDDVAIGELLVEAFVSSYARKLPEVTVTEPRKAELRDVASKRGLAKVRVHAKLVTAAQGHSTDMGQQQYFAHNSSSGELWSTRLVRYGYTRSGFTYWKTGENIFKVSGLYAAFPATAVKAWMGSPAHRQVILTRSFRDIGVGAVMSGNTKYITLDLGRRIQ